MNQTIEIINRVLPIIFLLGLGFWVRQQRFLTSATIEDLRKIVVNFALPAVLFISFLDIELKGSFFVIFGVTFGLCIILYLLGRIIHKKFSIQYTYFPYLITGFEYGMLGISLFAAAYGMESIGFIAVTDLGHEIFIWFVFLPMLLIKRDGIQRPSQIVKSFLSAPVVIAILASLIFNILNARDQLYQLPVTGGIMGTLNNLSGLTVPLILIIVGYGIKINTSGLKDALVVAVIRLAILLPLIFILNKFLISGILGLETGFQAALFTLLILPPPFIVPLYARRDLREKEKFYINNTLTIHTVISVLIFITYFILNPTI